MRYVQCIKACNDNSIDVNLTRILYGYHRLSINEVATCFIYGLDYMKYITEFQFILFVILFMKQKMLENKNYIQRNSTKK